MKNEAYLENVLSEEAAQSWKEKMSDPWRLRELTADELESIRKKKMKYKKNQAS